MNECKNKQKNSFQNIILYLGLFFAQLTNSLWSVIGKNMLNEGSVDPVFFSLIRDSFSSIIFIMILIFRCDFVSLIPYKEDFIKIFVSGSIGIYGSQLLYIYGLSFTTPIIASIWKLMIPVLGFIISSFYIFRTTIKKENDNSTSRSFVFLLTTLIGALIIIVKSNPHDATNSCSIYFYILGHILFFMECFSVNFFLLLEKQLLSKYPFFCVITWCYIVGAFDMFLTFCFIQKLSPEIILKSFSVFYNHRDILIFPLCFAIFFESVCKYSLITYVNAHLSLFIVTISVCIQPMLTAYFVFLFFDIQINIYEIIGTIVIIFGLYNIIKIQYQLDKKNQNLSGKLYNFDIMSV